MYAVAPNAENSFKSDNRHLPGHYNGLDASLDHAWTMLVRGADDRRAAFHTPVRNTRHGDGAPDARTVVLRAADAVTRQLRIHTDLRCVKVRQWRWVGGWQTRGKHYLASSSNIAPTAASIRPGNSPRTPTPLDGPEHPDPVRLRPVMSVAAGARVVLVIGEDDVAAESLPVAAEVVCGVAALTADRTYPGLSQSVISFRHAAIADGVARAEAYFCCPAIRTRR